MLTRRSLLSSLPLLALPNPLHAAGNVRLGIDVLAASGFQNLKGKRVGLITNHTGVDSSVKRTRQILHKAKGVRLAALYTPEHGLDGTELAGKYVASRKDPLTGLTAHSLYGPTRKPSPEMLKGIDVLVYDMQDIGSRSYTYISTMARCMEAAGDNNIEFLVLDRPNPLGGNRVEGPMIEKKMDLLRRTTPRPLRPRHDRRRTRPHAQRQGLDGIKMQTVRRQNGRLDPRHGLARYRSQMGENLPQHPARRLPSVLRCHRSRW